MEDSEVKIQGIIKDEEKFIKVLSNFLAGPYEKRKKSRRSGEWYRFTQEEVKILRGKILKIRKESGK